MHDDDPGVDGLDVLERGLAPQRWPEADRVAAVGRRRRRRRRAVPVVAVAAAAGLVVALTVPGSHARSRPGVAVAPATVRIGASVDGADELVADVAPSAPPAEAADTAAVATGEQAMTLRLLRQVMASSGHSGVTLSPWSLGEALAMLADGAGGSTRAQIASVLGIPALSPAASDAGWAAVLGTITADARDGGITLDSPDSLWVQRGLALRPAYLAALKRAFGAGVWETGFPQPAASAIDAWVSAGTHGTITRLFTPDQLDEVVAVLANATYFDARWEKALTGQGPGPFTTGAGRSVTVPYLTGGASVSIGSGLEVARLPYSGDRFQADVVVPTTGTVAALVDRLTPAALTRLVSGPAEDGTVILPRWTTSSSDDLDAALQAMGMTDAFQVGADFAPMGGGLSVQDVIQKDYLAVDARGTVAAAATGVAMATSLRVPPHIVDADRPFLFLVRDRTTGVILFSADVEDPAAG